MSAVKGPLGFWSFPIINAIMGMFGGGRRNIPALTTSMKAPSVINTENVTWTDWKGRPRNMSIKREIRQG